jgi:hypothetical protein
MAAMTGTAVAAGLELYYRQRQRGFTVMDDPILTHALAIAASNRLNSLANNQRYVSASDQDKWDAMGSNVELLLKTHAKCDPFKDYTVVEVEQTGDDHDRPDLIARDDLGLLVVDFKCKLTLKSEWIKKEHAKWRRSWQLYHYAIRRGISRFAVCLIAPHTRQGCHVEMTQVDEGYAKLWQHDAAQLWAEMDAAQDLPLETLRGNTSHSNEYGECAFWPEACSHGLDKALLASNLVQVERTTR